MKKEEGISKTKVLQDSAWVFITTILSRVGGLIFTIILARSLLPDGFGIYSLALSISIVFVTIADLGINQAMIRYVSSTIDKNRKKASAYFHYLLNLKIKVVLFSAALLLTLSYPLAHYVFHKPELLIPLILFSLYVSIIGIESFFESIFYINNHTKKIMLKEITFQTMRILLLLGILYSVDKKMSVSGAVSALLIASIITLWLIVAMYKKSFNFKKNNVRLDTFRVLKFIGFLTLANLSGVLFSYADTIIMGLFLSPEYIGYYRASINVVITIAGAFSFPGVFLATLTKIENKNLQQAFDKILKTLFVLILPMIIGLMVLARYFLVLIYGYEYLTGTTLIIVLAPFIFLFVMTSLFLNLLSAKEKTKELAWLTVSCTILNIFLDLFLIKALITTSQFNATLGVAIATLLSWTAYFFGGMWILKNKLHITFKWSNITKPLLASLLMGFVLILFNQYSPGMNVGKGIAEVAAGALMYAFMMLLMKAITKEDLGYFTNVIKRTIKK